MNSKIDIILFLLIGFIAFCIFSFITIEDDLTEIREVVCKIDCMNTASHNGCDNWDVTWCTKNSVSCSANNCKLK
jgi:hypothetical protein